MTRVDAPGQRTQEDAMQAENMQADKPESPLTMEAAGGTVPAGARPTSSGQGTPLPVAGGGIAGWLDRTFSVSARGSTLRTEALAGIATFATMAYVLAVNPMILAESGMDRGELITATALAACVFSILMGLAANLPLAVAPGMGANALFSYTIVLGLGVPWQAALGLVFWSGVIFLILAVTGVRRIMLDALPENLRVALTIGIGLFIAFIGIKNAGLVVSAPEPMLMALGDISSPGALLTLIGLIATISLMALRVPGAIVIVIILMTFVGAWVPGGPGGANLTVPPTDIVSMPLPMDSIWLAFDPYYLWSHLPLALPAVFTLVFLDLFSSLVAMNALAQRAGLVDAQGQMFAPNRALAVDAVAAIGGSMLGNSTTIVYAESAAGIESGARTGLAAVMVGVLFFLSLFLTPLLLVIPAQATAPALIMIGLLMFSEVARFDFRETLSSGAAVLTLVLMPITSITDGLAIGLMVYCGAMLLTGRVRELAPMTYVLVAVFALYYIYAT
jgi:AGZA family xanthine/uracil permease-like MFS transporter